MPYDSEHGKLWQDIKADLDKTSTRASKFAAAAEWAFGKKTARVLGVVALFAVVVALLFLSLDLYVAPTEPSQKKDLVLAVAQILAGTALLSGLYFTWRTLQVNREGQITERFTRAIDQLGHDTPAVRIGAIYALESIARESEHHYWPIVVVLTAYVRTRPSQSPEEGHSKPVKDRTHQHRSADVQAALYVLANRNHALDPGGNKFINLSGTDLRNADLRKAHLENARLRETDLRDAVLRETNFQGATLTRAKLNGAELHPSDFEGADLGRAHLEKADLEGAVLKRADLTGADLTGADLTGADLTGAMGVTTQQLDMCKSSAGATMPNGQMYEDWLKDKKVINCRRDRVLPPQRLGPSPRP